MEQPSDVLDQLEEEMNYLRDNLTKEPSADTEPLPELIGDWSRAEDAMNEAMDSLEHSEPTERLELDYEEDEEG